MRSRLLPGRPASGFQVLTALALLATVTATGCAGEDGNPLSKTGDPATQLTVPPPDVVQGWPCPPFDDVSTTEDKVDDDDDDTLTDCQEEVLGSDPGNPDSDGDHVGDEFERGSDLLDPYDTDNDGMLDLVDTDDDGDGVPTLDEDLVDNGGDGDGDPRNDDFDIDGIRNYVDNDDDNDLLYGMDEDSNGNGDILDDDVDNDGALNRLDPDDDDDATLTKDEDINRNRLARDDNTDGDAYYAPGQGNADTFGFAPLWDWMDLDDDGDEIPTIDEAFADLDRDFAPDSHDADEDADTLPTEPGWPVSEFDRLCAASPALSDSATALPGALSFGGTMVRATADAPASYDEYRIATSIGEVVSISVDTAATDEYSPHLVVIDADGCPVAESQEGVGFACASTAPFTCASASWTATGTAAYVVVMPWPEATPMGGTASYTMTIDALDPQVLRIADNTPLGTYTATEWGPIDTDLDGSPNWHDVDDDGDGATSSVEDEDFYVGETTVPGYGLVADDDTDADGVPNYLDDDDDGDGCVTLNEDTDGNSVWTNDDGDEDDLPDFLDADDGCTTPATFDVTLDGTGFAAYEGEQVHVVTLDAALTEVANASTVVKGGTFGILLPTALLRSDTYSLRVLVDGNGVCGGGGGDTGAGTGTTGDTGGAPVVEVEGAWVIAGITETGAHHVTVLDAADPQDLTACDSF